MTSDQHKCPACGRSLQPDRPDCIYCGYERPMDSGRRLSLKKNMVARTLGKDESAVDEEVLESGEPVAGAAPEQDSPESHTPGKDLPDSDVENALAEPEGDIKNVCATCGAQMKPDFKFCTSCGAPSGELHETDVADDPSSTQPLKDFKPPLATIEFQRHLSGFDPTPDNILFAVSAAMFLIMLFLPFGVISEIRTSTVHRPAQAIPIPGVVWFLSLVNFGFVVLVNFKMVHVADTRRMFIIVHAIVFAGSLLLARNIFFHPLAVTVLPVLFFAGHFYLRFQLREFPAEEFWVVALVMSSGSMLLIAPYIRTISLSATKAGLLTNPGFFLFFILSILLFTGAMIRKRRIDTG